MGRTDDDALMLAVQNVVAKSRAFGFELEGWLHEIGALRDERAFRLVEALTLTLRKPPTPGTVRHVDVAATELLRSLRE